MSDERLIVQTYASLPDASSCPGATVLVNDEQTEYRSRGGSWRKIVDQDQADVLFLKEDELPETPPALTLADDNELDALKAVNASDPRVNRIFTLFITSDFNPTTNGVYESAASIVLPEGWYRLELNLDSNSATDEVFASIDSSSTPLAYKLGGLRISADGGTFGNILDALDGGVFKKTLFNGVGLSGTCVIYNPESQTVSLKFLRVDAGKLSAGSAVTFTKLI